MARFLRSTSIVVLIVNLLLATAAMAQTGKGSISGRVADTAGGVLPGAKIELQPGDLFAKTDALGEFTVNGLTAGAYTVSVSYIGFAPSESKVTVVAGQTMRVEAVLKIASASQVVTVYDERQQGEVEAINRSRTADNIVQVLPAEVITSLPNANIADALGRLPSVTLERDEGEGKYVQIRGTEPRLTNVTIDGVNVPSPESGVRQIKLDVLASDLVDSVEINKTLQANMDGDGIGGSVNLRTKTAGDVPTITAYGIGGYTPIIGGRDAEQYGLTMGKRFGEQKKLGVLVGGTYDYNGRGINDIEPSPTPGSVSPHYDSIDLRDYMYYRTRWGLAGSVDYKLANGGGLYVRSLYSTFRNWGQKQVYTLNDGDKPKASQDWRRPDYAIGSLVAGGKHNFTSSWLAWDASVSRARELNGSGGVKYKWNGSKTVGDTCFDDPSVKSSVYRPQFAATCYTPGTSNTIDISNYRLSSYEAPPLGQTVQLNLQGSVSFGQNYHVGSHFGTIEFGGKVRNAHKFDDTKNQSWDFNGPAPVSADQFTGSFRDSNYYDKSYPFGAKNPDYRNVRSYFLANESLFSFTGDAGISQNNYDLIERVSSGYVMNTLDLSSRVRLVAGVRFEYTDVSTLSTTQGADDPITGNPTYLLNYKAGGNYFDVLPSASLRIGITKDSGIRLVYGRGLARPDPQDITQAVSKDDTASPKIVSIGNPGLKAEHSNNFDVLYEQYLKPFGMIEAGFFYKDLSDPIISTEYLATSGQWAGYKVTQPGNAGSAHVAGFEVSYQQHFTFLPKSMAGLGLAANYSYTTSQASGIPNRSDKPALLRQAPHTWNISPTYDRGRVALRVGLSYNGPNIYAYQWQDGADSVGVKGPAGDNYLYSHMQVDAQGTVRITRNLQAVVYGLNLNNEVFGFYNGSPQYVVQREYYKPTYAGGLKYTFSREK